MYHVHGAEFDVMVVVGGGSLALCPPEMPASVNWIMTNTLLIEMFVLAKRCIGISAGRLPGDRPRLFCEAIPFGGDTVDRNSPTPAP